MLSGFTDFAVRFKRPDLCRLTLNQRRHLETQFHTQYISQLIT
jgi:hypothetical protein